MSDTDVIDPSSIINPPPQSLFTPRRVILTVVVVGLVGLLVWGLGLGGTSPGATAGGRDVVVRYDPAPGGRVLRQSAIGVELKPNYDGRLTINGVPIPESQMEGAILPGSEAYNQLSPEERAQGPRPNHKNVLQFEPGKGKAIESYSSGTVDVVVRYWRVADGQAEAKSFAYVVYVT